MPWVEKEGRTVDEARTAALSQLGIPADDAEIEVIREGARGLFGFGGESALVRARPRSEAPDYREAFQDRPPTPPPVPPADPQPVTPVSAVGAGTTTMPAPEAPPAPEGATEQEPAPTGPESGRSTTDSEVAQPEPVTSEEDAEAAAALAERQRVAADIGVAMVSGILERVGLDGKVTTRTAGSTVYVEVFGDEMGILIGRGGKTLEALQEVVRAGVQRRLKARVPVVVDVESYWERRRQSRGGGRRRESGNRQR